MSGLEALQSVQFATIKGKRFAVVSADDWQALIEWLETLEDAQVVREALAELRAAGGDRKKARRDQPSADRICKLHRHGAQQRDQRERSNPGDVRRSRFPLQADQQSQSERNRKLLNEVWVHGPLRTDSVRSPRFLERSIA